MPITLEWYDVALRLTLTVIAGALVGINRTERGRSAGLRTTILVCLAASVSMIQANLLMSTTGKTPDSFVVIDLMRFPLGILTGMGFIGAGAILRRGDLVRGVTTAATLWMVTIIGLCLGGGQIGLGLAALALTLFVLWVLKRFEHWIPQDRLGTLTLSTIGTDQTEEIRMILLTAGYQIGSWDVVYKMQGSEQYCTLRCDVRWYGHQENTQMPAILNRFKQQSEVRTLRWNGAN